MLFAVSWMLMDQQYILNTVALHRNIHKIVKLLVDNENVGVRLIETLLCISPRNNGLAFLNSLFLATLWNRTTTNNEI